MATTLLQLRTRVRQRTDNEGPSEFVTDTELNQLINSAYQELYALLARESLHRSESVSTITATGADDYAVPTGLLGIIGVYRTYDLDKVPLERFPDKFRPGGRTGDALMYRVSGTRLVLYPKPSSGTYDVVYIPTCPVLTVDADSVEGVVGWEEFIVIDAAINVLAKEESNTQMLEIKRMQIIDRIRADAQMREFTETPRLLNVREGWRTQTDPADWRAGSNDGSEWDI